MLEYPLTKANRIELARVFRQVPRIDLSIECMLEAQMGTVYCDHPDRPSLFMLQSGPFYYFAGDAASSSAEEVLKTLPPYSLFMPSAPGWIEAAKRVHGQKLSGFDRYSFSGENLSTEHLGPLLSSSRLNQPVQRMDRSTVEQVWEQAHFVDLSPYDSIDDFVQRGIGYFISDQSAVIGAAYASLICSRGIEVSVYIEEAYRRQGIATALAAHLLYWSLANGLDPHWDAANPESCQLALKLGYKPLGSYLAYYLME